MENLMGKKGNKDFKKSKGLKKKRELNRAIKRCMMKINRWLRYQKEIEDGKRSSPKYRKRWDTARLEKHIKYLEKCSAKPSTKANKKFL
jgi:hypothetical protein